MSIFKTIAESPAMKRQLKESQKKKPDVEFSGPDGDYFGRLVSERSAEKNGNNMSFFEYLITEGPCEGESITNMYWFAAGGDTEKTMDNLLRDLHNMGITTEGASPEDLQHCIGRLTATKTPLKLKVTSRKSKGNTYRSVFPSLAKEVTPSASTSDSTVDPLVTNSADTIIGKLVLFQDEECIVSALNPDNDTLTLANPEDSDELWYQDVATSSVTITS
jgi:hypothetical protein